VFANPATSATRAQGGTLGLNWFLNRNVKAVLNYEFTSFTRGPAGVVTSSDEHAVLTRVQLSY
jgi:phosphate-selective porin